MLAGKDSYTIHSTATCYVPAPQRRSFLQQLQALPNRSLWRTFEVDGDGSWIYGGLILNNTLITISDGSYNSTTATDACSCTSIILRRDTGDRAKVTWVERSDVHTSDNYRAKLLGAIALQLLVKVALDGKYVDKDMRPRSVVITKLSCFMATTHTTPCRKKGAS